MNNALKMVVMFFRLLFVVVAFMSCKGEAEDTSGNRKQIVTMLDSWNKAAAEADFNAYFKYFTEDAVFIGTDATENWNKKRFMVWAKPFFDRGKAWNFTSLERNIYFNTSGKMAWFDELLSTQMKICRGSGVIVKEGSDWKIQQYVLSMTIPNELSDSVVKIKGAVEHALIMKISEK